jgi:K+-sensing histidine kinase KdpD
MPGDKHRKKRTDERYIKPRGSFFSESPGQGLGFHIIRNMAKAIGCNVNIQSQPKSGAVFILSI